MRFLILSLTSAVLLNPSVARAQWYIAGTVGGNATRPSTITIDQPSLGNHFDIEGVQWASESFKSPQYYGYRIGWLFGGSGRRWGIELEFVHPKMFGKTANVVHVRGTINGAPVDTNAPMNTFVSRYAMSHGINFALGNFVLFQPLGAGPSGKSRFALTVRGGVGPTIPHDETTIDNVSIDGYQIGGVGVQGAAGLDIHVYRWLSATAEYKVGYARPKISVPGGTGQTTALIHEMAFGVAIGVRR